MRRLSVVAGTLALLGARPCVSDDSFIERLRAHATLTSTAPATTFDDLQLELRLQFTVGRESASDGGGGTLRCTATRYSHLPCPAPTAKVTVQATSPVLAITDEAMGRNFLHFTTVLDFGAGGTCTLDSFTPAGLGAPFTLSRHSAPVTLFGSYVCTRDGSQFDQGVFNLWQYGAAKAHR